MKYINIDAIISTLRYPFVNFEKEIEFLTDFIPVNEELMFLPFEYKNGFKTRKVINFTLEDITHNDSLRKELKQSFKWGALIIPHENHTYKLWRIKDKKRQETT